MPTAFGIVLAGEIPGGPTTDATVVSVYVILILFIAWRMLRERAIRMNGSIWIQPVLLAILAALPIAEEGFTTSADIVSFIVVALGGVGVGWWQSTHSAIRADKTRQLLFVKSSPWGVLIYCVAFILRAVVRVMTIGEGSAASLWSSIALFFAVGILFGMRVHWMREYAAAPHTPPTPAT
jgi:hypothetical protein